MYRGAPDPLITYQLRGFKLQRIVHFRDTATTLLPAGLLRPAYAATGLPGTGLRSANIEQ